MLKILLLLIPAVCLGKDIKLIEDLSLQTTITEAHGKVVEFEQEDLVLVGHARQLDLSKTEKLVQIVWTEIRNANNANERVVLEEPLTGNFKYGQALLKAKTNMPVDYDPEIIKEAMRKLKKGEIDSKDVVMKGEAKNVKSTRRSLLDLGSSPKEYAAIMAAKAAESRQQDNATQSFKKTNSSGQTGLNLASNATGGRAGLGTSGFGANSDDNNFLAQQLRNPKGIGNTSGQATNGNNPANGAGGAGANPQNSGGAANAQNPGANNAGNAQNAAVNDANQQRPGGNMGDRDYVHLDNLLDHDAVNADRGNYDGLSNDQDADGDHFDLAQNNQEFAPNRDLSNNLNLATGNLNNAFDVNAANPNPENNADEARNAVEIPEIVIQVTTEGCNPRVDEGLGRVIVQDRAIQYVNGVLTPHDNPQDGACSDSNVQFAIHKRYDCQDCGYIENCKQEGNQSYACASFEKYWTDERHQEHIVANGNLNGGNLYTDLARPFAINREIGKCEYNVNLNTMQAIPQTQLGFSNRANQRVTLSACAPDPALAPIPITLSNSCPLIHDYARNLSKVQKKAVFSVNGIKHLARGCIETNATIPHEFVTDGCNANVDPILASFVRTGKRKVTLNGKAKIISQACEVIGQPANLASTREGCNGEYVHDFNANRSYEKHHFYYMDANQRKYLPGCMRSNVAHNHERVQDGYEFDDVNARATKKMAVFINPPQGRLNIAPARADVSYGVVPYQIVGAETLRRTNNSVYQGCYEVTQTERVQKFTRPDASVLEKVLGAGAPHRSGNLCQVTTEVRSVDFGTTIGSNVSATVEINTRRRGAFLGHSRQQTFYVSESRIKTTYPDGRVEYSNWTR